MGIAVYLYGPEGLNFFVFNLFWWKKNSVLCWFFGIELGSNKNFFGLVRKLVDPFFSRAPGQLPCLPNGKDGTD